MDLVDWSIRSVVAADAPELSAFTCNSETECNGCGPEGGNLHEFEVQNYIRHLAIDTMTVREPFKGHRLLAITEPSGAIAAVVAHERHEMRLRGEEVIAQQLLVAAIRIDQQGTWLQDHRLSSHLVAAAIRDGLGDGPRIVDGRVMRCNAKSMGMLARHAIVLDVADPESEYALMAGLLGDVVTSLPPPLPTQA